eukprot:TRINITY_DN11189_c0_g1_i1.p1 TRINITY_DN11189_c0_g1~~TRINITY_DN11189_c0_g1_i1.p1  ORF type:complete len:715 (+),score=120.59 TRINITY_DN11189_c0_g1_i1:100-2145(+)
MGSCHCCCCSRCAAGCSNAAECCRALAAGGCPRDARPRRAPPPQPQRPPQPQPPVQQWPPPYHMQVDESGDVFGLPPFWHDARSSDPGYDTEGEAMLRCSNAVLYGHPDVTVTIHKPPGTPLGLEFSGGAARDLPAVCGVHLGGPASRHGLATLNGWVLIGVNGRAAEPLPLLLQQLQAPARVVLTLLAPPEHTPVQVPHDFPLEHSTAVAPSPAAPAAVCSPLGSCAGSLRVPAAGAAAAPPRPAPSAGRGRGAPRKAPAPRVGTGVAVGAITAQPSAGTGQLLLHANTSAYRRSSSMPVSPSEEPGSCLLGGDRIICGGRCGWVVDVTTSGAPRVLWADTGQTEWLFPSGGSAATTARWTCENSSGALLRDPFSFPSHRSWPDAAVHSAPSMEECSATTSLAEAGDGRTTPTAVASAGVTPLPSGRCPSPPEPCEPARVPRLPLRQSGGRAEDLLRSGSGSRGDTERRDLERWRRGRGPVFALQLPAHPAGVWRLRRVSAAELAQPSGRVTSSSGVEGHPSASDRTPADPAAGPDLPQPFGSGLDGCPSGSERTPEAHTAAPVDTLPPGSARPDRPPSGPGRTPAEWAGPREPLRSAGSYDGQRSGPEGTPVGPEGIMVLPLGARAAADASQPAASSPLDPLQQQPFSDRSSLQFMEALDSTQHASSARGSPSGGSPFK